MDNLEDVQALRKLRETYEENLRGCGLELCEFLPEDVSRLLDNCVEIQMITNLHELKENFLEEYYYTKKKELIENRFSEAKLQAEIDDLDEQLANEQNECDTLEKFITATKTSNLSEGEMEHNKILLETQIEGLHEKQKSLKQPPKDLNIDELVRKVRLLELSRKADRKDKP